MGVGKAALGFGADWIKTGCHDYQELQLTYNGEHSVSTFSQSFLIGSSLNLQVSKTGIKSQIESLTSVLLALEHWKIFDYNGKMMSPR